jgi:hypothetical protein
MASGIADQKVFSGLDDWTTYRVVPQSLRSWFITPITGVYGRYNHTILYLMGVYYNKLIYNWEGTSLWRNVASVFSCKAARVTLQHFPNALL